MTGQAAQIYSSKAKHVSSIEVTRLLARGVEEAPPGTPIGVDLTPRWGATCVQSVRDSLTTPLQGGAKEARAAQGHHQEGTCCPSCLIIA